MERKEYSGWTNYETWNLALWIGEGSSEIWSERAAELLADMANDETDREDVMRKLADEIEADTTGNAPELSGFYADVLSAAMREVNYLEIAEHYLDDAS